MLGKRRFFWLVVLVPALGVTPGGVASERQDGTRDEAGDRTHWSFRPIRRPAPPGVRDAERARNPVDSFILARLEREGIAPSPEADRATLIRRLSLDLLGLPPTPEAVDAFLADVRPDAYERLVDRLLADPHLGERWGRHWLDQARYADSHGYTNDDARSVWPYRDWVIGAVNADMPFDRFTVEQLAGDLLEDAGVSLKIATGFHRNTLINTEGGTDREQFRVESVIDRVNTTGQVWLGISIGCAQCHDHKYDPFSQTDYYRLFAFFNSTEDQNSVAPALSLPAPEQTAEIARLEDALRDAKDALRDAKAEAAARAAEGEHVAAASGGPPRAAGDRDGNGGEGGREDERDGGDSDREEVVPEAAEKEAEARVAAIEKRLREARARVPTTLVLRERSEKRPTHVLERGDFLRPGAPVEPGAPAVLPPVEGRREDRIADRLDLARWLVDERQPLTARVTVNRVWMRLFGRGLVETEEDFGTQGTPPSHPELLDWLASELVRKGWSRKALFRTIVTSSTYRQTSAFRDDLRERDPANRLLARQSRIRVEAEIVRDLVLAASGRLAERIGGPSVHPPQAEGIYDFTQHRKPWPTSRGADRYRRTLYTFFWRSAPYPLLTTFDAPRFNTSCTRRLRSNTPLQSLTVANGQAIFELVQALAERVLREVPAGGEDADRKRIARVFRLCLARPPSPSEIDRLLAFLELERRRFAKDADGASAARPPGPPEDVGDAEAAAWVALARVIVNLDEFITRE